MRADTEEEEKESRGGGGGVEYYTCNALRADTLSFSALDVYPSQRAIIHTLKTQMGFVNRETLEEEEGSRGTWTDCGL